MRILIIITLGCILCGCGAPDIEKIKKRFHSNSQKYEQLARMTKEDSQGDTCFTVGLDKIGDYWEHSGKWSTSQNYNKEISLHQVLTQYSITPERYQSYKRLFRETGSERSTFCWENKSHHMLVFRAGLAVSGCVISIDKALSKPKTYGSRPDGGDFKEIISLNKNWFMVYECT